MTEKNQQEKNAAERQVGLLVNAFDKAQENGGVWLNKDGKKAPRFYQKGVTISPFNAIILGLHSDQDNYKTNEYTVTRIITRPTSTHCLAKPRNVARAYSQVRKEFLSIGTTGMSTRARKTLM